MLHGYDLAVWTEFHIERALRTVKHRIPLNLRQILHGLTAVRTGRIFRVLYPVGKATHRVHILAGRTVKQGHGRFAQHKGIFREGLVVLGTDIAIRFLRPVKELGGKDFHAAIQGKTVKGWTFQESHTVGAAGGSQNTIQPQKFQPPSRPSSTSMSTMRPPQWGHVSSRARPMRTGDFSLVVPLTIG